ncbi:MAG: hypothetical protein JO069_01375 [Verrucomicrobia bacterium]|nr:hypothetical protein [Verrucomicrobiota bacterium]
MRRILEREDHVEVPPAMYSDPFYRITYLIKEEIRKYKWIEGEKGRKLSWEQARKEWCDAYYEKFERFLLDTLSFPPASAFGEQAPMRPEQSVPMEADRLAHLPPTARP